MRTKFRNSRTREARNEEVLWCVAIAVMATMSAASAADMPAKAPPYKDLPVAPSWTGFYVGGDIDARRSKVDWATRAFGTFLALPINNPADLSTTSIRIGGFAGYNWHLTPYSLVGLEADIAWGRNSKTHSPFPGDPFASNATLGHDFVTAKLGWDGSLRGRVGFF